MIYLPLYPEFPLAAVDREKPRDRDPGCRRCALGSGMRPPRAVCMAADGEPGGLLCVGESPGREEDSIGRPFSSSSGKYLRKLIEKYWRGPVAFTNALLCHPGGTEITDGMTNACRGYLAQTIREAAPERVLALGATATASLLGRSPPIFSVRRGYGWLNADVPPVPVYLLPSPGVAQRNRFVRGWFESDLKWALTTELPRARFAGVARVVREQADVADAYDDLIALPWVAMDVEWAGHHSEPDFKVVCVALVGAHQDDAWVWDSVSLEDPALRARLAALVLNVPLVGHNLKGDILACASSMDLPLRSFKVESDTFLWRRLVEAHVDGRLEVAAETVGLGGHKAEMKAAKEKAAEFVRGVIAQRAKPQMRLFPGPTIEPIAERGVREGWETDAWVYSVADRDTVTRYNASDTVAAARLREDLEPKLTALPGPRRIWDRIVKGATLAIAQMERWGVAADRMAVESFSRWVDAKQREVVGRLAPYKVENWQSWQQVGELLYDRLKLQCPHQSSTGGRSTDEDALEALRGQHVVIEDLLTLRGLNKMRGTYADGGERNVPDAPFVLGKGGLVRWIRLDGRIHPSLKIAGTETGRMSCEDPNLQNIPRATSEEGRLARGIFVAPPGFKLLEFDQSQIELRIAAMLSGDRNMIRIFESGDDYHWRTTQLIAPIAWGKKPEELDPEGEERSQAKIINFSLVYGKGDEQLAAELGIPVAMARKIREAILGKFPDLASWIQAQVQFAQHNGYTTTWWEGGEARRRALPDIASEDGGRRGTAERSSYNTTVQGTASDYTLASVIEVVDWLEQERIPAKLCLTVHDSLLIEAREDVIDLCLEKVPELMTKWDSQGVPLKADAKVGINWGAMQKRKNAQAGRQQKAG